MPALSPQTQKLIDDYQQTLQEPADASSTIHVDEAVSKVAAFYEHLRTIIDWKEEHLMRRAAIGRKLRRRLFDVEISGATVGAIAEPLVIELIRGGYFSNDAIHESAVPQVQRALEKYGALIGAYRKHGGGETSAGPVKLIDIAACEIEELLDPSPREEAIAEYFFQQMQSRIKVSESVYRQGALRPQETNVQIYIGAWRALFRLDDAAIGYRVLKRWYPYWQNPSPQEMVQLAEPIEAIMAALNQTLRHAGGRKIQAACRARHTPYLLLSDLMREREPAAFAEMLKNPDRLEEAVRKAYGTRLSLLRRKMARAAAYSTASIFITKILSLLILEIVLANILRESLNASFLAADVAIPTALMALLVAGVRMPSKKNVHLAIMQTMDAVYENEPRQPYEIKATRRPDIFMRAVISGAYALGTVASFSIIFWLLWLLRFPAASIIIDMVFIALVLFAGNAIRTRAQELTVQPEKEGVFSIVADMFFLPLAGAGRWLSATWKQYNFIALLFSALIDMPFSTFVEFLDGWRHFLKERREELQ